MLNGDYMGFAASLNSGANGSFSHAKRNYVVFL